MKNYMALFLLLILPNVSCAQIELSEIMYDLEVGSDTGREWVELHNTGVEPVDLYDWKLFEFDKSHTIKFEQGGDTIVLGTYIKPNEYIVIADRSDMFLIDNPTYSGALFDSTFSLLNTGEQLILRDTELNEIDSVIYSPEWGASGDGNSLQKINGEWKSGLPTPGVLNVHNPNDVYVDDSTSSDDEGGSAEVPENISSTGSTVVIPVINESIYVDTSEGIVANAGPQERVVFAGTQVDFVGSVSGMAMNWAKNARYSWVLGDGGKKSGQEVEYTYFYEGRYPVTLTVSSGEYIAQDRIIVLVVTAEMFIDFAEAGKDGFVRLRNDSGYNIDIGGWKIFDGTKRFVVPKFTFVLKNSLLTLSNLRMNMELIAGNDIFLELPIGQNADEYHIRPSLYTNVDKDIEATQNIVEVLHKTIAVDNKNDLVIHKVQEEIVENIVTPSIYKNNIVNIAKEEKVVDSPLPETDGLNIQILSQGAVASNFGGRNIQKTNSPIFWWLMGVFSLILTAIYGVLISREKKTQVENKMADEFEIIEE